ncbi:hypothetical protein GCM10009860_25160 [Microbacterium mitrae]|nr:hypothetical protein [Microbacterium mitrae]
MDFWNFAAAYWWLVFPLMGVGSAVAGNMRRASKARHKRRLELLAAKRDLKAAEIQARATQRAERQGLPIPQYQHPVPLGSVAADAAAIPTTREQEITRLMAEHDDVVKRWLDYELDVAKLIAYPAMSDGRNELTATFLRAKRRADTLRPESADAKVDADAIRAYREAVIDFGSAFDVAERDAKRQKNRAFSDDERKRLDRALQLLRVAEDQGATQAERQVAYRRVREELDGLIVISDEAISVLEKKVAGEITSGDTPPLPQTQTPAQAQPPAKPQTQTPEP